MVFVPYDKKVSIVPDLADLPCTIEWPRDTRPAKRALVVSGVWMIFAMGVAMAVFIFVPSLPYGWVATILGIITLAAFLLGMSAIKLYASKDEITITATGIKTVKYGWIKPSEKNTNWEQISRIKKTAHQSNYETLELILRDDTAKPIPILLTRNKGATLQVKLQLEQFI